MNCVYSLIHFRRELLSARLGRPTELSLSKFLLANELAFYRAITEFRSLQTELAYRAALARNEDSGLPDVTPLVRTAEVHKQVRLTALPTRQTAPTEPRHN